MSKKIAIPQKFRDIKGTTKIEIDECGKRLYAVRKHLNKIDETIVKLKQSKERWHEHELKILQEMDEIVNKSEDELK